MRTPPPGHPKSASWRPKACQNITHIAPESRAKSVPSSIYTGMRSPVHITDANKTFDSIIINFPSSGTARRRRRRDAPPSRCAPAGARSYQARRCLPPPLRRTTSRYVPAQAGRTAPAGTCLGRPGRTSWPVHTRVGRLIPQRLGRPAAGRYVRAAVRPSASRCVRGPLVRPRSSWYVPGDALFRRIR